MKKEKQIRTHQRRTKSGKMVTVRAHTAKYDAADKAKEMATKKGAGKELENRKKKNEEVQLEIPFDKEEEKKVLDKVKGEEKKPTSKKSEKPAEKKTTKKVRPVGSGTNGPTPKEKSVVKSTATSSVKRDPTDVEFLARQIAGARSGSLDAARDKVNSMSDRTYKSWLRSYGVLKDKKSSMKSKPTTSTPAFTAAEFKEWYRGTGSAADKKVAKALRAQLGRSGYRKLEDEAIDGYSARGHLSMFKRVSGGTDSSTTGNRIKMPDKVREKKRKHQEYLRKVKESGMSIDEYNRLH